jgi:TfoX/Sxy family transcriptional regulator of competence genes
MLFLVVTFTFANVYYSKVEPYEVRDISSNVNGTVLFTDENMIGKKLSNKPFILIDDELDKDELNAVNKKLSYFKDTLEVNEKVLLNLKESLKRKKENYKNIASLSIKSQVEKDREFYDVVNSENSFLTTQKEVNSLKANIADLELRKAQLLKNIKDKSISAKGFVLYEIKVKPEKVVNIATPLATVADISKGLLTVYLTEDELLNAVNQDIYINGRKTKYKLTRISNIADATNISKYKAQIVVNPPNIFSKVVKIELREHENEK